MSTFPLFDSKVFPSRVEADNASTSMPQGQGSNPTVESKFEGLQDASDQFVEIKPYS